MDADNSTKENKDLESVKIEKKPLWPLLLAIVMIFVMVMHNKGNVSDTLMKIFLGYIIPGILILAIFVYDTKKRYPFKIHALTIVFMFVVLFSHLVKYENLFPEQQPVFALLCLIVFFGWYLLRRKMIEQSNKGSNN